MTIRLCVACTLLVAPVVRATSPLVDRIERADGIVIAQVIPDASKGNAAEFSLAVGSVLKGPSPGQTVAASVLDTGRPRLGLGAVESMCGLFFLQRRGGQLDVIPPAGNTVTNTGAYMPSDRCSAPPAGEDGAPVVDRVLKEVVHSVAIGTPDSVLVLRLFKDVRPADSAEIAAASVRFSAMSDVNLRLLGLAWRVGEGDAAAMQEIAKEVATVARNSPLEVMTATAIAAYSNGDPGGVKALGAIAAAVPGGDLEQAVSEAVRSIHSKESLAYAVRMMDSPNPRIRENAIATFSMFVLEIPILNDRNRHEALEHGLNPAWRKELDPEMENHIRFGPFADVGSEAEAINWWKGWYTRAGK